jgi:DNA-directed RNA polymerase II subunit RPB1
MPFVSEEEKKRSFVERQRELCNERKRINALETVYPDKIILRVMSQDALIKSNPMFVNSKLQHMKKSSNVSSYLALQNPDVGTVADTALGNPDIRAPCGKQDCLKIGCPGHIGAIQLNSEQYMYVPFCIGATTALLNCFCQGCNRLYSNPLPAVIRALPPEKRLTEAAKKLIGSSCLTATVPGQKPCPKRKYYWVDKNIDGIPNIIESNEKKAVEGSLQSSLPAHVALRYISAFSKDGLQELGFAFDKDKIITNPVDFIMRNIPVMPYPSRAPTIQKGVTHHCFLTNKLNAIVAAKEEGKFAEMQKEYLNLINGETKTSKGQKPNKSQGIFGLTQGKKSVIRGSMMGKRNEGTARGVASCAPIRHGTIGVPVAISKVFSQPLRVTDYNKKYVEGLFERGLVDYYRPDSTGVLYDCANGKKYTVYVGDVVGKFIEEGDWVVDNRHPTLSKPSMQAHRVVFGKTFEERRGVTIDHHGSDTTPSNMDFDGDDKNFVCPIDVYARAEAAYLLHVPNIIMSDSQNRPIVGLIINSVLASYLLTYREVILDETLFRRLLNMISCREGFETLFDRLRYYGVHPRSGGAIYSALLPPTLTVDTLKVDDEGKVKGVTICSGIIVKGSLDKSLVGPAHRSLIQEIYKKYGPKRTSLFLTDAVFVCNKWIGEYGFSCGIQDFLPKDEAAMKKAIKDELASVTVLVGSLGGPVEDPQQEEYRLKRKSEYFDVTKGLGVKLTKTFVLDVDGNRLGIMHKDRSGVKGDSYNLNQLLGVGGIKKYDGKFLVRGTRDGTGSLPQFVAGSLDTAMDGFVSSNYQTGYEPSEVFYDAKGGRASVINTNVDTAVTGYMQRKVGKVTEGVTVGPKGDVINTNGVNFGPVANCGYAINMLLNVEHPYKGTITFPFDPVQIADTVNEGYEYFREQTAAYIEENRQKSENYQGYDDIPLAPSKKKYGRKYVGTPDSIGLHRHTRFERTIIIARRADEIEHNSAVRLKGEQRYGRVFSAPEKREIFYDPVRIAAKEYRLGLLTDMMSLRNNGDYTVPAEKIYLNIH